MNKGSKHTEAVRRAMRASHTGLKFSEVQKKNHAEAHRKLHADPEFCKKLSEAKKGVPNPLDSRGGASEKNSQAKDWWFIKNQVHYRFRSLHKFVRDNKHLFTEAELTEYKTEGRAAKKYRATVMLGKLLLLKRDGTPAVPSFEWNGWTIGDKWEQGFYTSATKELT